MSKARVTITRTESFVLADEKTANYVAGLIADKGDQWTEDGMGPMDLPEYGEAFIGVEVEVLESRKSTPKRR